MSARVRRRGQPLVMLGFIMFGWVGLRAATWNMALGYVRPDDGFDRIRQEARDWSRPGAIYDGKEHRLAVAAPMPRTTPGHWPAPAAPLIIARPAPLAPPLSGAALAAPDTPPLRHNTTLAAAHQLLWMAAMSNLPSVWSLGDGPEAAPGRQHAGATPALAAPSHAALVAMFGDAAGLRTAQSQAQPPPVPRRWSGDFWMLARGGGMTALHGAAEPSYGASQMGAVIRYRLSPGEPHRLALYARVTGALTSAPGATHEGDGALGLSLRPIAALPVALAVEARASRFDNGSMHLRPAAMAVTELPPVALPLGFRGDLYAAGGYVGGAAATGFADGQAHIDHAALRLGPLRLRLGAGVWGGIEQGASRLDVGPSANVSLVSGHTAARLGIDWRFRLAGDAAPKSGPAVTLAAGF